MTPPPAKKPEKSIERGDWKMPVSDRNQYHFCVFFKLPPEVRLKIYSDLIQSGNLEVLRLCQTIHGEAIGTVHEYGIYRVKTKEAADLYFGDAALPGAEPEINRLREEVQNVEVYTDLKNFTSLQIRSLSARFPDIGYVRQEFKYPKISGKNCWVYLTEYDLIREPHTRSRLEIVLRAVQQFDNVFLNFHGSISQFYGNLCRFYDPDDFLWMEPTANLETHPKIIRVKSVASFESEFEILRKELEPKFGPPTWLDSPDAMKRMTRSRRVFDYRGNVRGAETATLCTIVAGSRLTHHQIFCEFSFNPVLDFALRVDNCSSKSMRQLKPCICAVTTLR